MLLLIAMGCFSLQLQHQCRSSYGKRPSQRQALAHLDLTDCAGNDGLDDSSAVVVQQVDLVHDEQLDLRDKRVKTMSDTPALQHVRHHQSVSQL